MAGPSPVEVYVPVEDTHLHSEIDPGSGIVGDRKEAVVLIYFEGNRFRYANVHTFADRCMIAEGRLREQAPTIARSVVPVTDLHRVGTYFPQERRVEVGDGLSLTRIAKWIGLWTGDGFSTEQLAIELGRPVHT